MKLIKTIEERWSPRSYDSRPVNEEQLALLFEAARWAPSCNNAQEWAYYYTTREYPEAHARLAECLTGGNRAWAPDAPVLLVSCGYKNFPGTDVYNRALDATMWAPRTISIALQAASMGIATASDGRLSTWKPAPGCWARHGKDRTCNDDDARLPRPGRPAGGAVPHPGNAAPGTQGSEELRT